jgi:hypothetical protein
MAKDEAKKAAKEAKRLEKESKKAAAAIKEAPAPKPKKIVETEKPASAPAKPAPLNIDPSTGKSKEQRLSELLDAYKNDAVTAKEYHRLRAKILAEP